MIPNNTHQFYTTTHSINPTETNGAIPQYYGPLPQKIPGQCEAENFSDIKKLTEKLKNSCIETTFFGSQKIIYKQDDFRLSLKELHALLLTLSYALPNTQLSLQEKAVCEDLCVQIQKMIDAFTKPSPSDMRSRITSFWLHIRNWLSGESVWLQQIQKDLLSFRASTNLLAHDNDIRSHAVGILCRSALQQGWSLTEQTDLKFTFATGEDALKCAEYVCSEFGAYLPDQGNDANNEHCPLPEGYHWIKTQNNFSLNDSICKKILHKSASPTILS